MKTGWDELVLIADRSGSMEQMREDALGGINRWIKDQKELKDRNGYLTLILFDHEFITFYDRKNLRDASPLKKSEYVPRGNTALLKAMSDTIDAVGAKLEALPESERPERVIVFTVTDGQENHSNYLEDGMAYAKEHDGEAKYTKAKLNEKTTRQHDIYKWEFAYAAAGENAFDEGHAMGMTSSHKYTASKIGSIYAAMSDMTKSFRLTGQSLRSSVIPEETDEK